MRNTTLSLSCCYFTVNSYSLMQCLFCITQSVYPHFVFQPPANIIPSKNAKLLWSVSPLERQGRLIAVNVIKMVPGPQPAISNKISIWALHNTINRKGYTWDDKFRELVAVWGQLKRLGCDPLASVHWVVGCTSQKAKQRQAFELLTLERQYFQPPCL